MSKARMNHGELQTEVATLGKQLHWEYLHVQRSRVPGGGMGWATACNIPGWPDMTMWNRFQPGRHIAMELKVPPDKVSEKQQKVLDRLAAAGFEVYVVTPADLQSGAIARILLPLGETRL